MKRAFAILAAAWFSAGCVPTLDTGDYRLEQVMDDSNQPVVQPVHVTVEDDRVTLGPAGMEAFSGSIMEGVLRVRYFGRTKTFLRGDIRPGNAVDGEITVHDGEEIRTGLFRLTPDED